ncbi:MAG: hypothetical protein ACI9R3_002096 [Verrucomicrobiales bacterium]|jgi:hypothetical protein
MTKKSCIPAFCISFPALVFLCLVTPAALAQQSSSQISKHPAAKVVQDYLRLALARKWADSAKLIEPESLTNLRDSYVRRIKRPGTTVENEMAMVKKLGETDVEDVAKLPPASFYAAYNTALQKRYDLTEDVLKLIANTLELRLLSIALEGDELAHILVRTSHRDNRNQVANLELISLRKIHGKWLVALNEQIPLIIPLDEIDPVRKPPPVK